MKAGIIAEGRGDLAVITNILHGALNIDRSDIQYIVPEYFCDETDLAVMRMKQHSTWSVVRQHCIEKNAISVFFNTSINDERFLVIHLDTAERFEINYEVVAPPKSKDPDYVSQVRQNVVNKIKEWLDNDIERTTFAVAVEETDAWVLTIYEDKKTDTGHYPNPKETLEHLINRPNFFKSSKERKLFFQKKEFERREELTQPFRKLKNLTIYRKKNQSLDLFCSSLENFG